MAVASPTLGRQDIPELPRPDGSGDTPEMAIPMLQGAEVKLSSLRGKVVILDFFLSTCPHCRDHAPHMVELYNQYRNQGLTVLGLAADPPEKKESIDAFIKELKVTYPVGYVTTEVIAYYVDSHDHSVPQIILFGPDGKMARRLIGWNDEIGKELKEAVMTQMKRLPAVKSSSK
jgi:cytochrome c biogenesis protein CcmG/thiol:disulfide interchange protein DsbE